ncbi:MAG: hypothetical protein WCO12_03310 [bacterium]
MAKKNIKNQIPKEIRDIVEDIRKHPPKYLRSILHALEKEVGDLGYVSIKTLNEEKTSTEWN